MGPISNHKILDLKKNIYYSEERINQIGKDQFPSVLRLSNWLFEILEGIEYMKEKEKNVKNIGHGTRVKLMRKGMRLSKDLKNFERKVVEEFSEGNISEEIGKQFGEIIKILKSKDSSPLKEKCNYFSKLIELNKNYKKSKEDLEEIEETLKKNKNKIKLVLKELNDLENSKIDLEKVQKYEEFQSKFEKLKELRKTYISSLISVKVPELLLNMGKNSLGKYGFPSIEKNKLKELINFFSENSELSGYALVNLCELFDHSEKKLSYIFPEISKFKRIVLSNRYWFESILNLERSNFLFFDLENQAILNFYSTNIPNSKEIIEFLIKNKANIKLYEEEYLKNQKFKEKKENLSNESKSKLENQSKEINEQLELLNSDYKVEKLIPEVKTEDKGFFSKIVSFFK